MRSLKTSLKTLHKALWKFALTGAIAALLVMSPAAIAGGAGEGGGHSLGAGEPYASKIIPALWPNAGSGAFPGAGAVVAAALLLLPFGLSTLRIRRKDRSA